MRISALSILPFVVAFATLTSRSFPQAGPEWRIPGDAPLLTRWAETVNPTAPLPDYPRPQMVRRDWMNLNGVWEYGTTYTDPAIPSTRRVDGTILVPFPVESALSGVMKHTDSLWYRRQFRVPATWRGKKILLHFGGVDWSTRVFVNGILVGEHRGGYDAFSFDITGALKPGGLQELIVAVIDPTDGGDQPRGKQVRAPRGIWYTSTTGIWQTVWCEPVAPAHIADLVIVPDVDRSALVVTVDGEGIAQGDEVLISVREGTKVAGTGRGALGSAITVQLHNPRLWSPDAPFLYDLTVRLLRNRSTLDEITSYTGMRKVEIARDDHGVPRILLNGKEVFLTGPLDQGFWPDGISTAPTDAALRYDIEVTKKLGFTMTRKHVKVEPSRWYYWADRLGLLVWQDMPSGRNATPESRQQFEQELRRLVTTHQNHPSIMMWVIFNEGWGQFDTERLSALVRSLDPTRLVNSASGWTDRSVGDVVDIHSYPHPRSPLAESDRVAVLGEFGGLGLAIPGHTWKKEHWGYKGVADTGALMQQYARYLQTVNTLRLDSGLCAAVYTQLTDVEVECNGLLTYDRAVIKGKPEVFSRANSGRRQVSAKGGAGIVRSVNRIIAERHDGLYTFNRAPLVPGPLMKLPIGQIVPSGWLRSMLELERDGMVGALPEISPWLDPKTSAWADTGGKGSRGWEELPYWLKGAGDLAYVLNDSTLMHTTRFWIEMALASQREDGWFGPRDLLTSLNGKPDLWPHMVMLNVMQSFYEATGDRRILPFMIRYFAWQRRLPAESFGAGYWPKMRMGDNIESALWLYNRTGLRWLLDLAATMHANMARWDRDVINWHNVNVAQGFRAAAVYYQAGKDISLLQSAERNYRTVMDTYGRFPGGGFAADENARPGFIDPRQGFETCGIVEFMHSFEMLTKISGGTAWADRCEELAFNSLPAAMTPDRRGLHYLTCANQVQLDKELKSPGIQNGGTMFSYSPFQVYRCCQHNVSHGWPYYAEELWLATWDRGLCASLYAPSTVTARVGDGTSVTITEDSAYPFDGTIRLHVSSPNDVNFRLYLRVPGWCQSGSVTVNGDTASASLAGDSYLCVERTWRNDDRIEVQFDMPVRVTTWPSNKNAVSVGRGPLWFSLKIAERWERYGTNPSWPEWEVFPASPWNYGLLLDTAYSTASMRVEKKKPDPGALPWTVGWVPLVLQATGRRIDGWEMDYRGLIGPLQSSPARTNAPEERLTLVPMGAARLRVSSFPTVSPDGRGVEWVPPARPKPIPFAISYSYVNRYDDPEAPADGLEPARSNDEAVPRMTWWAHKGTAEWIQYDFPSVQTISSASIYWFDEGEEDGCRVPASWNLLYRAGDSWIPVERATPFGCEKDAFNSTTFSRIVTTGMRLMVQLQPGFSGGILEWKVGK